MRGRFTAKPCAPSVAPARFPSALADDPKLRIEKVDSAPPDMEVIELLKPERVQEPETAFVEPARKRR